MTEEAHSRIFVDSDAFSLAMMKYLLNGNVDIKKPRELPAVLQGSLQIRPQTRQSLRPLRQQRCNLTDIWPMSFRTNHFLKELCPLGRIEVGDEVMPHVPEPLSPIVLGAPDSQPYAIVYIDESRWRVEAAASHVVNKDLSLVGD